MHKMSDECSDIQCAKQHKKDAAKRYKQRKQHNKEYVENAKNEYRESVMGVIKSYFAHDHKYQYNIPIEEFEEVERHFGPTQAENLVYLIAKEELKPKGYKVSLGRILSHWSLYQKTRCYVDIEVKDTCTLI